MTKLPRIQIPSPRDWSTLPLLSSVRGRIIAGFGFVILGLVVRYRGVRLARAGPSCCPAQDERRRELEAKCERALAQLQESEEALREQARRDPLTGVLNHGAIADELRSPLAEGGGAPHAVAMVDLDGLKAVNDPLAIRSATLSS